MFLNIPDVRGHKRHFHIIHNALNRAISTMSYLIALDFNRQDVCIFFFNTLSKGEFFSAYA